MSLPLRPTARSKEWGKPPVKQDWGDAKEQKAQEAMQTPPALREMIVEVWC